MTIQTIGVVLLLKEAKLWVTTHLGWVFGLNCVYRRQVKWKGIDRKPLRYSFTYISLMCENGQLRPYFVEIARFGDIWGVLDVPRVTLVPFASGQYLQRSVLTAHKGSVTSLMDYSHLYTRKGFCLAWQSKQLQLEMSAYETIIQSLSGIVELQLGFMIAPECGAVRCLI